jgi:iron complex outermembrane recepter protein
MQNKFITAATAVCVSIFGSTVQAQQSDSGVTLQEVVVTAQKRETNLQETPISISVMSSENLENRQAVSLGSLADGSIPSLRVAPFVGRSSAFNVSIRGVGASMDANQPARDSGVGVYVDGVFLGRAQGLGMALLDIERIEVLKGPQGTLFGRNSQGGAVSIITKAPSGEFRADARVGLSNFDGRNAVLHLDMPKIGDLSVKIDALVGERRGTTENTGGGSTDFNAWSKHGVRVAGVWKASDSFDALYSFENSRDESTPYHAQLLVPGPFASALQRSGASLARRDSSILGGFQPESVGKNTAHTLAMNWSISDDLQLRSITAYRELEQSQLDQGLIDAISTFAPNRSFGRLSVANVGQDQTSQELQLLGKASELEYVFGAFLYRESVNDDAQTPQVNLWNATGTAYTANPATTPLDFSKVVIDRASEAKTESIGVFGQASWSPAQLPRLNLTVGGRYTKDSKDGRLFLVNGSSTTFAFDDSWSRLDPMVAVSWKFAEDVMGYAKWATGFRAGGANSRSLSYRAFEPEEVVSTELGLKSEFLNGRFRVNLAVFDATIKDKQMDFFFPLVVGGSQRTVADTTNASTDGESRGAELEMLAAPVENLTLGINYTLTKADPLLAPNPYVVGNPLTRILPLYAPKKAGSASVDYVLPLGGPNLKFHLSGNWADGAYTSEIEQTLTDSSFVVNSRLTLTDVPVTALGATAEFALWSRNLVDDEHLFYKSVSSSLGTYGIFNDPRTYGFEVRLRFGESR